MTVASQQIHTLFFLSAALDLSLHGQDEGRCAEQLALQDGAFNLSRLLNV